MLTHANCFSFIVLGDWGGDSSYPYTTPAQIAVAAAMARVTDNENIEFIINVGDNFYKHGIDSVTSPRWQTTFESVYDAPTLKALRWFTVAGNHDHEGNVSAQIAYTALSKRWFFPSLYYTVTKKFTSSSGKDVSIQYVFIDTVTLAPVNRGDDEDKKVAFVDDVEEFKADQQQWDFVYSTLNSSTADWLIVVGHYSLYSTGSNGPNADLVQKLKPALEQSGAALYLSGHDHDLQHLADNGVNYVVSGAGHLLTHKRTDNVPAGVSKFFFPKHAVTDVGGLVIMDFQDDQSYSATYFDSDLNVLYQFTGNNPRSRRR